jgi:hypothetical protein
MDTANKTHEKMSLKLELCQDDINETVKDFNKLCNRLYDIQLKGSMETENDTFAWVESLASATEQAKELKAKLQGLKQRRALLRQVLKELEAND